MKVSHKLFASYVVGGLLLLFTTLCALYYLDRLNESSDFITHELVPINNSSKDLRNFSAEVYTIIQLELLGGVRSSQSEVENYLDSMMQTTEFLDNHKSHIARIENYETIRQHIAITKKNVEVFTDSAKTLMKAVKASTGVGSKSDEEFDALYDDIVERLRLISIREEFLDAVFQRKIGDARYLLAHGHLLTAEILSGDFGEDFQEVIDSFDAAYKQVQNLKGFEKEQETLLLDIHRLKALAQKRYDIMQSLHERKSIASKNFNESYSLLNLESKKLEKLLHTVLLNQRSIFDKSKQRAQLVMYAVSFLGISLVILIIVYFSKNILTPFSMLAKSIQNLSSLDDTHVTPGLDRPDEIGNMARIVEDFKSSERSRNETLEDLKVAITEAQKANEAKSQFLANMSHEIRTPLNSIIGFSEILADDELTFEQRNMAGSIKSSSETLLLLVNDILDLAKVESGEMTLEEIEVNLEDLLFDVGEAQVAKVLDKKIELNIDLGETYALILSDPTRLKQIFINLLNNAIKFTEVGEVLLSVSVLKESESSQTLRFSIKDTGIGMDEEQTQVIFDAFKQADGSTTRKYGGTGLGLNITRKILLKMGAEIQVKSELGVGTEFYFDLVFKKFEPDEVEAPKIDSFENKKVLIVDDNENARAITSSYFSKVNISNDVVSSGEEALDYLSKNDVDLLILDLMMPMMDGYQVATKAKELYPHIHQIAVTADIRPGTIARVREVGFDAYLLKPVRRQIIFRTIDKVYGKTNPKELVIESKTNAEFIPQKILVVDDNKMNLKLAEKIFKKMGHKTHLVDSGQECLELLEKETFDIVFMDMQMPEMSGIETTEILRKRDSEIPIIALTANAFESDRKLCLEAGMNDFTTKPLRRKELYQIIQKYTHKGGEYKAKRILIIEDDKTTSALLYSLIEDQIPYATIKVAENGMEALTLIGSFHPHYIILDFMLPDMDGVDVMKFIKTHQQFKDVKVVINSSLKTDDERIKTLTKMADIQAICKGDLKSGKDKLIDFLRNG